MVKSLSGHVTRTCDGLVFGKPRKQNRENRYSRLTSQNRKTRPREAAAIIMLRRKGYTYNQLASAFERSTSYIYKICRLAMNRGSIAYHSYKTGQTHMQKLWNSGRRMGLLLHRFSSWIGFIEGSEDKPP